MVKKAMTIWLLGLVSLVPYGIYYLLFEAQRDEYALWITLVLFWIFGFWGVIGPLISIIKIRRVMRLLENAQSGDELKRILQSAESEEAAIDLFAQQHKLPRFIARKVYKHFLQRVINTRNN